MNREVREVLGLINAMMSEMDRAIILEVIKKYPVGNQISSDRGMKELRHMRDLFTSTTSLKDFALTELVHGLRIEYQSRNNATDSKITES